MERTRLPGAERENSEPKLLCWSRGRCCPCDSFVFAQERDSPTLVSTTVSFHWVLTVYHAAYCTLHRHYDCRKSSQHNHELRVNIMRKLRHRGIRQSSRVAQLRSSEARTKIKALLYNLSSQLPHYKRLNTSLESACPWVGLGIRFFSMFPE